MHVTATAVVRNDTLHCPQSLTLRFNCSWKALPKFIGAKERNELDGWIAVTTYFYTAKTNATNETGIRRLLRTLRWIASEGHTLEVAYPYLNSNRNVHNLDDLVAWVEWAGTVDMTERYLLWAHTGRTLLDHVAFCRRVINLPSYDRATILAMEQRTWDEMAASFM